jgi:pseudaminic acid synthase
MTMSFQQRKGVYIVAELSANHGNSLDVALDTVRAAKEIGADAIKIQTYTPDSLTLDIDGESFMANPKGPWAGTRLYDLYKKAALPLEWHSDIFNLAREIGIDCFSSPFSPKDVDFLEELDNPVYKIASFEITDIPLIRYAASKGKPVIMSTGVATLEDITLAIETCKDEGNSDITILKCTSAYPAAPEDANLLSISDLANKFNVNVGLSDHTMGAVAPVMSVAMGATVIEKHFILDKNIGGPDAHFSMDKEEFKTMIEQVRAAEKMLGQQNYALNSKQVQSRLFSRSLYISNDIKKGEQFTSDNIRSVRPGKGLHPKHLKGIVGKTASQDVSKGTPMSWDFVED